MSSGIGWHEALAFSVLVMHPDREELHTCFCLLHGFQTFSGHSFDIV